MREMAGNLGVSMSAVIPVKNYNQELELDPLTDILLLSALNQMLRLSESYFDDVYKDEEDNTSLED